MNSNIIKETEVEPQVFQLDINLKKAIKKKLDICDS